MPATSSSPYGIISVVLRRSPAEIVPHHHHHAVVLPELIYYFTITRWIEEVKASSSCTCVEHGGAIRSALDPIWIEGQLAIWIAKTFDYINRVS